MTSGTLELRAIVSTSLEPLLGQYKFSNGETVPAISVTKDNGEIYPPEGTKIIGLEVVIQTPTLNPTPMLQGYKVKREWTVYLKQWEKGKDLEKALEKLLSAELDDFIIDKTIHIPANYQLGVPLGTTIRIHRYALLKNL